MKQTKLSVHPLAYLEGRATTILNFHNNYYCGKQSGIEIIRCGKRLATNGDISLSLLPKDTDNRPKLKQRHVSNSSELRTELFSEEMHQDYQVNLVAKEDGLHLHLSFSQVPPKKYSGQLSFQLHLFPVFYWGKGFQSENDFGIFPRQFTRSKNNISPENGEILAQGRRLNLAPEEKQLAFGVESQSGTLDLIDASEIGISGCFVIREVLQLDSENPQIHWKINLPELEDYVEEKQIQYSQVGYHPAQKKWAVIECDLQDSEIPSVTLSKLSEEGIFKSVKAEKAKSW